MSMPSSRLDVATTAGSRPALSSSSMSARCSLLTEPWCARASTGGAPAEAPDCAMICAGVRAGPGMRAAGAAGRRAASRPAPPSPSARPAASASRSAQISLSRAVSRSASRRELANTSVERCSADQVDDALLDVRPDRRRPRRAGGQAAEVGQLDGSSAAGRTPGRRRAASSSARSGTGTTTRRSNSLCDGGCTTVDRARRRRGSARPPRPAARWPTGRSAGPALSSSASSRSSDSARWAPRLVPATACTSSTITVSTPASGSRAREVSSRNSDSGVVIRTSGGVAGERPALLGRGVAGADADPDVGRRQPEPGRGLPDAGQRRAQVALDVDGQRLERRDVEHPAALRGVLRRRARPASRSSAQRNAASVLPEPVGATTRACRPALIASQAPACAAVGAAKRPGEPRPRSRARTARGRRPPSVRSIAPWSHGPPTVVVRPAGNTPRGYPVATRHERPRAPPRGHGCPTPTLVDGGQRHPPLPHRLRDRRGARHGHRHRPRLARPASPSRWRSPSPSSSATRCPRAACCAARPRACGAALKRRARRRHASRSRSWRSCDNADRAGRPRRHGGRPRLRACSGARSPSPLAVAFVVTVPVNRWLIGRGTRPRRDARLPLTGRPCSGAPAVTMLAACAAASSGPWWTTSSAARTAAR